MGAGQREDKDEHPIDQGQREQAQVHSVFQTCTEEGKSLLIIAEHRACFWSRWVNLLQYDPVPLLFVEDSNPSRFMFLRVLRDAFLSIFTACPDVDGQLLKFLLAQYLQDMY